MEIEKLFGDIIKQLRKEKNLSQEDFSFETDLHRTYISSIERGRKSPTINTIFKLAKALRVKPSKIFQLIEYQINNTNHLNEKE